MRSSPDFHDHLTSPAGLATRLRNARGALAANQLALRAGWPPSKVSRIEHGKQMPTVEDLRRWAQVLDVDEAELGAWQAMLATAQEMRGRFEQRMRGGQLAVQREYTEMMRRNSFFRFAEVFIIPRFLQTPQYTRAVLTVFGEIYGAPADDLDAAVAERQVSTQCLYNPKQSFEAIMYDSVLTPGWIERDVMIGQLDRLQSAMGLPNLRIGIYPTDGRPVRGGLLRAPFEIYGAETVFFESIFDDHRRTEEIDHARANAEFDALWSSVLTDDEARATIIAAQQRLRQLPPLPSRKESSCDTP